MTKNSIILAAILGMFGLVAIGTNASAQGANVLQLDIPVDISGQELPHPCGGIIRFDDGSGFVVHVKIITLPNGETIQKTNWTMNVTGTDGTEGGTEYVFLQETNGMAKSDSDFEIQTAHIRILSLGTPGQTGFVDVVMVDLADGTTAVEFENSECR